MTRWPPVNQYVVRVFVPDFWSVLVSELPMASPQKAQAATCGRDDLESGFDLDSPLNLWYAVQPAPCGGGAMPVRGAANLPGLPGVPVCENQASPVPQRLSRCRGRRRWHRRQRPPRGRGGRARVGGGGTSTRHERATARVVGLPAGAARGHALSATCAPTERGPGGATGGPAFHGRPPARQPWARRW